MLKLIRLFILMSSLVSLSQGAWASNNKAHEEVGNRIDFTKELRDQWQFSDEDLKSLQYYVASETYLEREVDTQNHGIVHGRLFQRGDQLVEVIDLPAGTAGVAVDVSDRTLSICFESQCDGLRLALHFGVDPGQSGPYNAFANHWQNHIGVVTYDGQEYRLHDPTHLQIDASALNKLQKKVRTLPGHHIDQN